ncbi:MAG TPA: hypothetical protein VKA94_06395 [Hyphomicrobiales bacterium]|nr:hypothetical protein [Hyphomicrobiales bacterium]
MIEPHILARAIEIYNQPGENINTTASKIGVCRKRLGREFNIHGVERKKTTKEQATINGIPRAELRRLYVNNRWSSAKCAEYFKRPVRDIEDALKLIRVRIRKIGHRPVGALKDKMPRQIMGSKDIAAQYDGRRYQDVITGRRV